MIYGIGNPGAGLGQAQKCGRVKMVNMIQTNPSDIGSPVIMQI